MNENAYLRSAHDCLVWSKPIVCQSIVLSMCRLNWIRPDSSGATSREATSKQRTYWKEHLKLNSSLVAPGVNQQSQPLSNEPMQLSFVHQLNFSMLYREAGSWHRLSLVTFSPGAINCCVSVATAQWVWTHDGRLLSHCGSENASRMQRTVKNHIRWHRLALGGGRKSHPFTILAYFDFLCFEQYFLMGPLTKFSPQFKSDEAKS